MEKVKCVDGKMRGINNNLGVLRLEFVVFAPERVVTVQIYEYGRTFMFDKMVDSKSRAYVIMATTE